MKKIKENKILKNFILITMIISLLFFAYYLDSNNFHSNNDFLNYLYDSNILVFLYLIYGWFCVVVATYLDGVSYLATNKFRYSEKYKIKYKNAIQLNNYINDKLKIDNFKTFNEYIINKDEKIYLYYKRKNEHIIKIWVVADLKSYTNTKEEKLEKYILDFFESFYGKQKSKDKMEYFLVICVHKYTKKFEELIRMSYDNYTKDLGLPIGVVFEDKKMYIPSAEELNLINIESYNYMHEEFFKVIEAKPIKK